MITTKSIFKKSYSTQPAWLNCFTYSSLRSNATFLQNTCLEPLHLIRLVFFKLRNQRNSLFFFPFFFKKNILASRFKYKWVIVGGCASGTSSAGYTQFATASKMQTPKPPLFFVTKYLAPPSMHYDVSGQFKYHSVGLFLAPQRAL